MYKNASKWSLWVNVCREMKEDYCSCTIINLGCNCIHKVQVESEMLFLEQFVTNGFCSV